MLDPGLPLYTIIFLITFTATVVIERLLIPYLKKNAEQPIYDGGPSWHASKSGTPTMGGLGFLLAVSIAAAVGIVCIMANGDTRTGISLISCAVYAIGNSVIGIVDDLKKISSGKNRGLRAHEKLLLQSVLAALFLLFRYVALGEGGALSFSFGDIEIGLWYYPLAFLALIGTTNCVNLTDGVDGLASSVAFAAAVGILFISAYKSPDTSVISSAVVGACTAFLIFNLHPARIFMGDTGSLFLGALLSAATVSVGNPLLILLSGIVFVIEGTSVIIQVICYKLLHKRIFRMSPLHHHLEKCGWSENKICATALLITLIASAAAIPLFLQ